MYYECHITLYKEDIDKAKLMARDLGYKVSSIDGDPVLGDIVLGYITLKEEITKISITLWKRFVQS